MNVDALVVDASVALKWVVSEADSSSAVALRSGGRLMAPDLIVAECANALWKKARLGEFSADDAMLAARTLEHAEIELRPMRGLLAAATQLAIALEHPAYDCFYLALAREEGCPLITADDRMAEKIARSPTPGLPDVVSLTDAAETLGLP